MKCSLYAERTRPERESITAQVGAYLIYGARHELNSIPGKALEKPGEGATIEQEIEAGGKLGEV